MSRVLEQRVEINGEIGSSFISAFRDATGSMSDLRQESRQLQRELDRLGNDFRNGRIHQSQYTEETRRLTRELDQLEQKQQAIDAFKGKMSNGWNNVKATASIATIGAAAVSAAAAVDSVNIAGDFEAQMSKVAAKTNATESEMKALTATALQLGASTSLSASQSAVAMDDLAAGGMTVNQIIEAMPGIIAGAEASGEDLSLVSNTVSSALSIWGMEAGKASKVSDILAKSANISAASVEDFSFAFKYAGKPAADLGMTIEETAAAISIMTNSGIDGSSAGTALRASLLKLASPTKEQTKLLNKLNVSMADSEGNAKPLSQIIGELDESMKGMTNVEKVSNLGTLVGTEAVSGFMTLMSAGEDQLKSFTKQLENSAGSSAKASAVMMDNFSGAKEQMLGAFESAQIAAASPMLDVLKDTFSGVSAMIEDNIPQIEAAGERVADVMKEIFAPFIEYQKPFEVEITPDMNFREIEDAMMKSGKPIKPVITPDMSFREVEEAMAKYEEESRKYELFGNMDLGDRVDYMLDQTIAHVSDWVKGDGGEALQGLFSELAGIAADAWATSFSTLIKGSVSELAEGDVGSAVAMGAAANAMTGGLLMTGGLMGGKYLLGKGRDLIGRNNAGTTAPVVNTPSTTRTRTNRNAPVPSAPPTQTNPSTQTRANRSTPTSTVAAAGSRSNITKYLGKAALPLTLATGAISVATSDNKSEAVGSLAGSLAGGLGGAKLGAAIGTVIAPGIGTAIGGAIGGLAGGIAGSGIGSKVGDWVGSKFGTKSEPAPAPVAASQPQATQTALSNESANQFNTTINGLNEKATALSTNMVTLTTTFELTNTQMTSAFTPIQTNTTALSTNLTTLNIETALAGMNVKTAFDLIKMSSTTVVTNLNMIASNASSASAAIASINNIGSASQRVISALNRLEQRINNASVPAAGGGTNDGGRLAYE